MLKDDRTKNAAVRFLDDWMDHRMSGGASIKSKYEDFDPALLKDMRDETRRLFQDVLDEGAPITALFDRPSTTVSRRLAEHYGFEDVKKMARRPTPSMTFPNEADCSPRAVWPPWAAPTARPSARVFTSCTKYFVARWPAAEDVEVIPTPAKPGESVRQSSETRVEDDSCGQCHRQFEPLVWGMVRYRPTGAYAETDLFDKSPAPRRLDCVS